MNGISSKTLWAKPFLLGLVLIGLPRGTGLMAQDPGSNPGAIPRFAVVGLPTPIASSVPPAVQVDVKLSTPPPAPRFLDLDGPPVISTTNPGVRPSLTPGTVVAPVVNSSIATSPPPATTAQPTILQAQGSVPINSNNSVLLPRPFVSQPQNYGNTPVYSNQPAPKPGLFSNLGSGFNKPNSQNIQTVAPPTSMAVSSGSTRLTPVPMESQIISQQVISQPGIAPGQVVVQGNQQPWFGQRVWEWMNPSGRDSMGVTTLPVTPLPDGAIISTHVNDGPILMGQDTTEYGHGLFGHHGIFNDGGINPRCNPQPKFFLDAEVLLWFINGQEVPALVTQGTVGDPRPGALGQPGTTTLYGGGYLPTDFAAGGRFTAGYWFGSRNIIGIDAQYFFMGQVENTSSFEGFGNTFTIGRPFTNALNGTQQAEQVYQPAIAPNPGGNSVAGSVTVKTMERFDGATANLRWGLIRRPRLTTDIQTGFRWQQFNESLGVVENLNDTSANGRGGFIVNDQFQTFNNFYGGNFSALNTLYFGRLSLGLNGKLGIGITNQSATINGYTSINDNGVITTYPGGLLTQKSNIGTYSQSGFSIVPEMEFNAGYQLSEHLKFIVGYNLIYWSNVARPGGLIDTTVNPNLLPPQQTNIGPQRPAFNWNNSDLWIMGANIGVELKY